MELTPAQIKKQKQQSADDEPVTIQFKDENQNEFSIPQPD